jgi:hypothetical protein
MATQIKDGQQIASVHDATDMTTHDSDAITQQMHELTVHLVRQGQDLSLRSLQVWADLARQIGPTRGSAASAAMVSLTYDLFEKMLAAHREVVDGLVATQRRLAHRCVEITATLGDDQTRR